MVLSTLLTSDNILLNAPSGSKSAVLRTVLNPLKKWLTAEVFESVSKAVFEREHVMSTGVGKGVAIPHAKTAGLDTNLLVICTLESPIDFESIDGEPVDILLLLVGPSSNNRQHILLLSQISKLMSNDAFRAAMRHCKEHSDMVSLFLQSEQRNTEFD